MREIGYTSSEYGFDADTCAVNVALDKQSPDIAQGVDAALETRGAGGDALDRIGAGDQGMMFGFACDETPQLMPLPLMLAHALTRRLATVRRDGTVSDLLPDGKAQVTVRYRRDAEGAPEPVASSASSSPRSTGAASTWTALRAAIVEHVVRVAIPAELLDDATMRGRDFVLVNPTGRFEIGGPMGDAGLTGRKIIVDTYGGMARHGGGAFSGKDPTKVDRSAAYACRWVAKNIVAAGLARRCELQVAYAIGVAQPGEPQRRDVRHPPGRPGRHRGARARALRPAPGGDPGASSTCGARSIARRPPTGISAASRRASPGSAPIAPRRSRARSAPARRTPDRTLTGTLAGTPARESRPTLCAMIPRCPARSASFPW